MRASVFVMMVASLALCGCASDSQQVVSSKVPARAEVAQTPKHGVALRQTRERTSPEPLADEKPIRLIAATQDESPKPKLEVPDVTDDGGWQQVEGGQSDKEPALIDMADDDDEMMDVLSDEDEELSKDDSEMLRLDIGKLALAQVIESVHQTYPLVEAAYLENQRTEGNTIAAQGAFDTKLKAASENGPTGFYQTYRQKAAVVQPLYSGGELYGGYRIGRGDFEPWYQERQTNDGGEFKVGAMIPLLRNRDIDARRAELWRAEYDQQIAQPEIRGQLIGFTLDASLAYWKWVAEGRKYFAEQRWLKLADERNGRIRKGVELEEFDPPVETDNERAIAKRRAKVADQLRKVQQAAIKLSMYLREQDGTPIIPTVDQIPEFPDAYKVDSSMLESDIVNALEVRPDLQVLRLLQERLQIDYQEACNMGLPQLDGYIQAGQDVGAPTSSKRDKSEFEVDFGFFFDMPVQRRKAIGKMQAVEAKIAQVAAKERLTVNKIEAGLRAAFAGLTQAYDQLSEATEARRLAEKMATIERRSWELGASDLLKVALREQYALEAIEGEVAAYYNFFSARSVYFAEQAFDRLPVAAEQ